MNELSNSIRRRSFLKRCTIPVSTFCLLRKACGGSNLAARFASNVSVNHDRLPWYSIAEEFEVGFKLHFEGLNTN